MKSFTEIQFMKAHHASEVVVLKRKHNSLNQIDMLSGEGATLRKKINEAKGVVKALEWVMNDNISEI